MTTRRWIAAGVVLALLVGLGVWALVALRPAAGPTDAGAPTAASPRSLTTAEAERLAVTRFLAYQDGSRAFAVEVATPEGPVALQGRVDYRNERGIAAAALGGDDAVISWDADTIVGWVGEGDGRTIPTAPPVAAGAARPLNPATSNLDTVLKLLSSLGADRPENAQLLQRSDAQWVRTDDVDGVAVDVFAGPSDPDSGTGGGTTRFWVDEAGALRRFEADLPTGTVELTLRPEEYVAVAGAPELG